jgi:sialic acid synthase SpsE
MKPFAIAGRPIGPAHPPLVIAELSGNHNRSLDRALSPPPRQGPKR